MIGQQQIKPKIRIVQIDRDQLPQLFQPIGQRRPVDDQRLGRLWDAALVEQPGAERPIILGAPVPVDPEQLIQISSSGIVFRTLLSMYSSAQSSKEISHALLRVPLA